MRQEAAQIREFLRTQFGIQHHDDEEDYLRRRVHRRLSQLRISSVEDYIETLKRFPDERLRLLERLSVTVTEFFRDPRLFKALREKVIGAIVDDKIRQGQSTIRIWSAACATGQEPYSLAADFLDYLEIRNLNLNLEIIATDINSESLETAGRGVYPAKAADEIPAHYMNRYFHIRGRCLEVDEALKKRVRFMPHDLKTRRALLNQDLIVCRYVLVYMDDETQRNVIDHLCDQLVLNGFLAVGPWVCDVPRRKMDAVNYQLSIYRRRQIALATTAPTAKKIGDGAEKLLIIDAPRNGNGSLGTILRGVAVDRDTAVVILSGFDDRYLSLLGASIRCATHHPVLFPRPQEKLCGGSIYVVTSDRDLSFDRRDDGVFFRIARKDGGVPHEWLEAFRSAAITFRERCIAVLMIQDAHKGMHGLRIIQERGGAAFVLQENSIFRFEHAADAIRVRPTAYALPAADIGFAVAERLKAVSQTA